MKKMKFTLGLALSMLILGASVVNAAPGNVAVSFSATGCHFYSAVVVGQSAYVNGVQSPLAAYSYTLADIQKDDTVVTASHTAWWIYGSGASLDNLYTLSSTDHAEAYTEIYVALAYKYGNELKPSIKRTITVGTATGNWAAVTPFTQIVQYLYPTPIHPNGFFRPIMDRETGVAEYWYADPVLPLLDKTVMYSIHYEISVHDEFDAPGTAYDPPLGTDVITQYGLQIIADESVVTDPETFGGMSNVFYWPAQRDFVFTAESATPITVATDPVRPAGGIIINDNEDGTYTVTIRKINKAMKIYVYGEAELESDETGNEAIASDAVWAAAGTLNVQAANPGLLSIYAVTGQLYKQIPVSGNFSAVLPKGLYIVQLNGKAYKIVN